MPTTETQSGEDNKPAPPFMMSLLIGTTPYVLTRLDPDPEVAARAFRLQKMDGESYDVRQDTRGRCECECKGFLRWGGRIECKHIRTLRAAGLFVSNQSSL
jgi:hypothetical protein